LALAFSSEHEFICRWSDNIRLLEECEKAGLISSHIEETMRNAYIALRSMIHKQALQNKSSKVSPDMFLEEREQIISAWRNVMSDPDWGGQFS
jgi:glutamate-ammonia-ligase adenylyltransferase